MHLTNVSLKYLKKQLRWKMKKCKRLRRYLSPRRFLRHHSIHCTYFLSRKLHRWSQDRFLLAFNSKFFPIGRDSSRFTQIIHGVCRRENAKKWPLSLSINLHLMKQLLTSTRVQTHPKNYCVLKEWCSFQFYQNIAIIQVWWTNFRTHWWKIWHTVVYNMKRLET